MKRTEKPSGASIGKEPPLQTIPGTFSCFKEISVQQQWPGDEQGAHTARYALPLSHKHLCFHPSSWAEEGGCFGVPEAGKQPQHQPFPQPIETSPLEPFHQLAQGVDEASGAPDTMELRKKRQRNLVCDVPTRSHYQLHYLEHIRYAQVKGTTHRQRLLLREGNALLQEPLRSRSGLSKERRLLCPAPLWGALEHTEEVGAEGCAGGTPRINRLQKDVCVHAPAPQGLWAVAPADPQERSGYVPSQPAALPALAAPEPSFGSSRCWEQRVLPCAAAFCATRS